MPDLGWYVKPAGRAAEEGDLSNIDAREGTVYAAGEVTVHDTGERFTLLSVVHVHHGALRFGALPADEVGSAEPPAPATLDSLIKMCGRQLLKSGRHSDVRYFTVVHVAAAALAQPRTLPDMPSVFGDDEVTSPRPVCEQCGRPLLEGRCPKHDVQPHQAGITADVDVQVAMLLARLDALGHTEHNELRRDARQRGLTYLEAGAQLSLGDLAAYGALLARWERQAAMNAERQAS